MNVQDQSAPPGKPSDKPLERYVRLLEVISGFPDGISPSAITEMLGIPKATAYRLIRGLADVGLVEMTAPPSAACRLGGRLERLLFAGASDGWLRMVVRPVLLELAERTGEACFIARFGGDMIRSVEMVAPDNHLRPYILPGQEITAHTGASAKAILAYRDSETIVAATGQELKRFTSATKTNLHDLLTEFEQIRTTGIAYCIGEDVDGFAGVAAPIFVPGQDVQLSVCITGTISTLINQKKAMIEAELRDAALRISAFLEQQANLFPRS